MSTTVQPDEPTSAAAGGETIPAAFDRLRRQHPERVLLDDGRPHSLADLDDAATRLALRLVAADAGPGDRIAIQAPNGVAWAIAALAVLQIGATIVPVSTRYSPAEAADLIDRSGAALTLAATAFLGRDHAAELRAAGAATTVVGLDDDGRCTGLPGDDDADPASSPEVTAGLVERRGAVTPETIAFVQFTSGTTGAPKGALLRHGALVATTRSWVAATGLRTGDRYAVVAPFFHISGYKTGLLACLLAGATAYPVARFDPAELLELVATRAISVLQGPPTLYHELMARVDAEPHRDIGSLRLAVTGGTVVPPAVVERMRRVLGLDAVVTSYGITEATGVVSICRPGDPDDVVGATSGRAITGTTIEIRPLDPPEPDGRGEILVHSPHLMAGYLDDPEATEGAIDPSGRLHTGDVGYLDGTGNLVLTGRLTDLFIVGGFNAYPAEIEAVLAAHDSVAAAAVIGVPDDRLGEVGAAFVVPVSVEGIAVDEVQAFAADRLAGFKRPRTVSVVEALPLNAVGKVDKAVLRARWIEQHP